MRPGILRPGSDRRTQDGDDFVLIASTLQDSDKIRQRGRVARLNPKGFPVGGDGPVLIAPDPEQMAQKVILRSVAGPVSDRRSRRGDGLVDCLQPLITLLSTQKDCAQAPDVPRLRGPHRDELAKSGDRVVAASDLIEQVAEIVGRLRSQRPRRGVVTYRFLTPRGYTFQNLGQVVIDPDVVRKALRGRLEH